MDEISLRFNYHAPNENQRRFYEAYRASLREIARDLTEAVPDCRERSLAITHLEEAMMWGNAAVARRGLGTE